MRATRFCVLAFAVAVALSLHAQTGQWVDISIGVEPGVTPVYPGDAPASFTLVKSMAKGDKLNLSDLHFGAHTGTHVDAPLHFIADGAPIEKIPVDKFIGPARIIECSKDALAIDAAELNKHDWKGAKRILFKTRNSYQNFWNDRDFHKDFTYVAPDAAQLLADAGVVLVGIDYHSLEKFGAPAPKAHLALLGKGAVILEGLDLRHVSGGDYELIALPAKFVGREGAPARAVVKK